MSATRSGVAPDILALLDATSTTTDSRPGQGSVSIARARQQHEDDAARFSPPSRRAEVGSVTDILIPSAAAPIAARIYRPVAEPVGALLWIHGGGWVTGSIETADAIARALCARCGLSVVSTSYRLAPEYPFPHGLDDVRSATEWMLTNRAQLGGASTPVLVGGDSAGGNLAAVVARDFGREAITGQVLVYPVVALDQPQDAFPSRVVNGSGFYVEWSDVAWAIEKYVLPTERGDHRVSPLNADAAGSPPAVIVVAGFDPLRDEGVAFANLLTRAGVEVELLEFPALVHGAFDMTGRAPSAEAALSVLASAIDGLVAR
ncbi:alpha/beta hydrolase [Pseudolysinimonas sp.]|uniref:alpha/beta hydrolase n=1 Tax=Pseudolysinimonas sp. TaxID=2680009 RepID=UPI003782FAA0